MPRARHKLPARGKAFQKPLNIREMKFVKGLIAGKSQTLSALEAGYPKSRAGTDGSELMKDPRIIAELASVRAEIRREAHYDLRAAMMEADEAIQFARETENANAYVKACELKSKLNGLLIEKHQHQVASFSLNIGGINDELPKLQTNVPSEVLTHSPPVAALPHDVQTEILTSGVKSEEDEEEEDLFS